VLLEEHYRHDGLFTEVGIVDGRPVAAAEGMARIDGARTVPTSPSENVPGWPVPSGVSPGPYPLSGLTVLDLGVIVAGAVVGELFAEQGARVIRIENVEFPDGMRRSFDALTASLARGHRGKESVGLDLRSELGRELFYELVARADIVTSNFKPGTLERLGISYDELVEINPRIVCVESSAFGDTGPWRTAMGYGPLVRAGTGQTWLWRESAESDYFADGITIYPDHLVGRVCAVAALACVLDRLRSGCGAHAKVAQSDVALVQIAELLAAESVRPGSVQPPGDMAVHLLDDLMLRAAGDDQWVVVDPQTPAQLAALRAVVGDDVAGYVRERAADDVACELQAAGVPAARMLRVGELPDDAAFRSRELYDVTQLAGTTEELLIERFPVRSGQLQLPRLAPTPMFGAHTRTVLGELGRSPEQIERLIADGIAQESRLVTPETAGR
jgi:crotonobetainyl-CoA:carnitine CoA-transferase CaiB-like acyl-CoA transferase